MAIHVPQPYQVPCYEACLSELQGGNGDQDHYDLYEEFDLSAQCAEAVMGLWLSIWVYILIPGKAAEMERAPEKSVFGETPHITKYLNIILDFMIWVLEYRR